MAKYVNVDRDTPLLLPYDLHEWVADNDLAQFVLEAVSATDLRGARVNERGTGSAQYPPSMMLALLIYCYATGVFSSRRIERATYDSVSVRYLCANEHPDHDTIATFRRRNGALIEACFAQVLELAGHMGLLKLGTICIDGTKLAGNADGSKNRTLADLEAELERLQREVGDRLQQAEEADREDGASDGLLLPEALTERSARQAKLAEAKGKLEARLKRLEEQRKASAQRSRRDDDKPRGGRPANPLTEAKRRKADRAHQRINVADPDAHSMPTRQGRYLQGYNAQAVVCAEGAHLIAAARLTNEPTDRQQLRPDLEALAPAHLAQVKNVCADSGYYKRADMLRWENEQGLRLLCPPTHQNVKEAKRYSPDHPREREKRYKQLLIRRLKTTRGKALYRKRNSIAEGAFGLIKNVIGFDHFRLRGLEGCATEWNLATLGYNCLKIAQHRT